MSKLARTLAEMEFAVGLDPCPSCGTREVGDTKLGGQDTSWALRWTCPECGKARVQTFHTAGPPYDAAPPVHELGNGPSTLLTATELEADLARQTPRISPEPTELAPAEWRVSRAALGRAMAATNELAKLGLARIDSERARLKALLVAYGKDEPRVFALEHPHPSKGTLDPDALRAHMRWLQAGRTGPGRLELEHVDLTRKPIGTQQLTGMKLVGVKLVGAALGSATIDDAAFRDVDASGANFHMASLRGAWIEHGKYVKTRFTLTDLDGIKIDGADLTGADFERAIWKGARIVDSKLGHVRFGNSRIDDAEFTRCDLRHASFAKLDRLPEPTTRGTRFEECDLRDTDWTGRDLSGAAFVRCQLTGAKGKPDAADGLEVTGGDVSRDALLRQLV